MGGMKMHDESALLACGCYVLLWRREVDYVGQSENPFGRIGTHSRNHRFDRVWFIPCAKKDLLDLEDYLIFNLRPKRNKEVKRGSPMTESEAKEFIEALVEFPKARGFNLVKALGLKSPIEYVPSPDPPNRSRWVPGLRRL
jgi:hypothetical protein